MRAGDALTDNLLDNYFSLEDDTTDVSTESVCCTDTRYIDHYTNHLKKYLTRLPEQCRAIHEIHGKNHQVARKIPKIPSRYFDLIIGLITILS